MSYCANPYYDVASLHHSAHKTVRNKPIQQFGCHQNCQEKADCGNGTNAHKITMNDVNQLP
jgi:uncharacterized protein YlaI